MSGEAQSASALRFLLRSSVGTPGNGDDIANINTANLPDGSHCYVTENRSLYVFAKRSTLLASDTVIVPIAGGGRWLLVSTTAGAFGAFVYSTVGSVNNFDATGNWAPANTANFAAAITGLWNFSAAGALLTYNGPTTPAIVRLTATIGGTPAPASMYAGVSYNGDISGALAGSHGGATGATFVEQDVGGSSLSIASQRVIPVLSAGDSLLPVYGGPADEADGTIFVMQLTIQAP